MKSLVSCMEISKRRGGESTALRRLTKWLLTGNKCRSDRFFCQVGWWKDISSGGKGGRMKWKERKSKILMSEKSK